MAFLAFQSSQNKKDPTEESIHCWAQVSLPTASGVGRLLEKKLMDSKWPIGKALKGKGGEGQRERWREEPWAEEEGGEGKGRVRFISCALGILMIILYGTTMGCGFLKGEGQ